MGVPEAVLSKVGSLPDIASMSKDDLTALCKKLYDQGCVVFGEKFDEEYQVKKRDMEIHNLEMETSESHGTFKIPKLKKVKIIFSFQLHLLYSNVLTSSPVKWENQHKNLLQVNKFKMMEGEEEEKK